MSYLYEESAQFRVRFFEPDMRPEGVFHARWVTVSFRGGILTIYLLQFNGLTCENQGAS